MFIPTINEERELFKDYLNIQSLELKNKIFEIYSPYIKNLVRKIFVPKLYKEDLLQEGYICLLEGINKYENH